MMRRLLCLGVVALASLGFAQEKSQLVFEGPAKRKVWVGTAIPGQPPETAVEAQGAELEFDASAAGSKAVLYVWNEDTGNLAAKNAQETTGTWNVTSVDEKWIAQVKVRVESGGKPVESASVRIQDKARAQNLVLDSSMLGEATFWAVQPGSLKVTVEYSAEGKAADPIVQTFDLKLKREKPIPVLVVGIADNVKTVDSSSKDSGSGGANTSGPTKTKDGGTVLRDTTNPFGQIIAFLIAVAVAAALLWFGLQWMKKNQAAVQAKLEKMGVEIPNPEAAQQAAAVAAPVQPMPVQKIVLDDADPNVPVVSQIPLTRAPAAAFDLTGQPRLVGDSGLNFDLAEGDSVVSRESGEIVVPGEATISRQHAMVKRTGTHVTVLDLGSTNGTFVNGRQISQETELNPGDWVQFGAIRFRYEG